MKNFISKLLNKPQAAKTFSSYIPKPLYPDDVFLVSYPKSGNTWVRFLLANILQQTSNNSVDFHTVQSIIPEVIRNDAFIQQLSRPRIMKSHAYNVSYPRTIYILRDGRDVYVSYYLYRQKTLPEGMSFKDFLSSATHYPCLWSEHVKFWLDFQKDTDNFLLVRYEDLISDTYQQLQRILNFISLNCDERLIQGAIEASSFSSMKNLEFERGRPYKSQEGAEVFVRRGAVGDWRNFFSSSEKEIFNRNEGNLLVELNYAQNLEW